MKEIIEFAELSDWKGTQNLKLAVLDCSFWQALGKSAHQTGDRETWVNPIPCPENKKGCLVMHWGFIWEKHAMNFFKTVIDPTKGWDIAVLQLKELINKPPTIRK